MKKEMIRYIIVAIVAILIFVVYNLSSDTAFTPEEEEAYMKDYSDLVMLPSSPEVLIKEIDNNVHRMSKQGASDMIDGLIYSFYNAVPEMESKVEMLQLDFKEEDKEGMDFNNPNSVNKVKDETLKGFLKEMYKNHFFIEEHNGSYYIYPDIQYVLDTYGKYMTDDLRDASQFVIRLTRNELFDRATSMLNFDLIAEKIIEGERVVEKHPDSFYIPNVEYTKDMYYKMYFGIENDYIVDNNNKVLDEVIEQYKKTIDKYPESHLAKDLIEFINKLSETNNEITDDIEVWLYELIEREMIEITNETEE